ncbi:MAG: nucleotidyltransferase substrate binding protein [Gammaproteobacteria bacterium]|nr:nucleotidyltransferase substrate binding protein [Gammaproteobacteria bacterium]MCH9715723.1 nucleotidyltransferase substrate binding protein [Gammaproteobacteria bacterium]MCH9762695.1 nucleotidyltransferase substrate binding protein [Gammaproteobacteria bacterium]
MDVFEFKRGQFEKALGQLKKALDAPKSEYTRDAVIQRFEFTYELAWKALKAYLKTQDIQVLSPKETLKVAYQQGLIADASAWSELHLKRNLTSHTYDEGLAETIYDYLKASGFMLFSALQTKLNDCS